MLKPLWINDTLQKIDDVTVDYEADHLLVWFSFSFASSDESSEFWCESESESLKMESLLECRLLEYINSVPFIRINMVEVWGGQDVNCLLDCHKNEVFFSRFRNMSCNHKSKCGTFFAKGCCLCTWIFHTFNSDIDIIVIDKNNVISNAVFVKTYLTLQTSPWSFNRRISANSTQIGLSVTLSSPWVGYFRANLMINFI